MRRSLASVNVCGFTRLLVPAMFVAIAVSTLTANDALGWLAAAATVAVLLVVQRVRGTAATCAISPSAGSTPEHARQAQPKPAPEPAAEAAQEPAHDAAPEPAKAVR
jgi:hypothetical protein